MAETIDLSQVSEGELRTEIAKRERERRERAEQELREKITLWLDNLEILKRLVPKHKFQHCNDARVNEESGCLRCILVYAERQHYWPDDWAINLTAERVVLPQVHGENDE